VQVVRKAQGNPEWTQHDSDILFGFVMQGVFTLEGEGSDAQRLAPGDAFVTPPGMRTRWSDPSDDVEILEVSLPGAFRTQVA
jgi:quercetin dioxygenase-like cupin family protein